MFDKFVGQDLQGRDFRGQKLIGADFSNADIRGANFTNAILTDANFENAKAGIASKNVILLLIALFILFGVAGGTSGLGSVNLTVLFHADYLQKSTIVPGCVGV